MMTGSFDRLDLRGEATGGVLDGIETVGDFLNLTARSAIEVAIAGQRTADTYGPAYHAHIGSQEAGSQEVWAGQPNASL